MKWLSKIFGKSQNENAILTNQSNNPITEEKVNVLEGLFVNNTQPVQEETVIRDDGVTLKEYLEQDFLRKGYEDGYNGHSTELLNNKVRSMKADFRYNLNLKIDVARQDILKLENHKIDVDGMSNRLAKQIENQINVINQNINELEAQIALSSLDEGLVMIGIHQYRDGFIRGTEAYQQEKLIAVSTGLFN